MPSKPRDPSPADYSPQAESPDRSQQQPRQQQAKMTPELVEALFSRLGPRVNERLKDLDEPDV